MIPKDEKVEGFLDFVRRSPTAFHACQTAVDALEAAGYERLEEARPWRVVPGGRYFLTRNRSAVVALRVPEDGFTHFQLVVSHGDSPMFKLKPGAESVDRYVRLDVERYGSIIMSTWMDRPLSVAGRLLVRNGEGIRAQLVDLGRDALLIPNLPIHFNRGVNEGYAFNAQIDMQPLYGDAGAQGMLLPELAAAAGVDAADVLGGDLFVYNRMPGTIWGARGEYFSSPRIDDLECAYASLRAFLAGGEGGAGHVSVYALLDNEEVGSSSKQGANSTLLGDALARTARALGMDDGETRGAIASSVMLSADNAHAIHPNRPEKYDPLNCAEMNGGLVVKRNAHLKYATDGVSDALVCEICRRAGVPVQHFVNRADLSGGSTLGSIAGAHVSMLTADVGLAQLAMHSSFETAGTRDLSYMETALRAFYGTDVRMTADGEYALW